MTHPNVEIDSLAGSPDETRPRILVIDDDPDLLLSLQDLLTIEGDYQVATAASPEDAVAVLGEFEPDLALVDVCLGQTNGLDLIPQLKSLRPGAAYLVMTADRNVESAVRAVRADADDYLLKPLEPARFLQTIKKHLDRRRIEFERQQYQRKFRAVFEQTAQLVFLLEPSGKLMEANEAALSLAGLTQEEVTGISFWETPWWSSSETAQKIRELFDVAAGGMTIRHELETIDVSGHSLILDVSMKPILDESGRTDLILAEGRDISELREALKQLAHRAHHDPLTELPNRVDFEESLDRALARAIRHNRELVVFFIDLDGLKQVNDECGHATGDELLIEVAQRLRCLTRKEDAVSRISGDEFCTFCADIRGPNAAQAVAARMTTHLSRPAQLGGHEIAISASIGAARYPADGSTVHDLLRKADSAMYQVKRGGGDGYTFFSEAQIALTDPGSEQRAAKRRPQKAS